MLYIGVVCWLLRRCDYLKIYVWKLQQSNYLKTPLLP